MKKDKRKNISFVGIKPEAHGAERHIVGVFSAKGLRSLHREEVFMDIKKVEGIYGKVRESNPEIYRRIKRQMLGNVLVVIVLSGKNAVEQVLEIVGEKPNAPHNHPHQLRYIHGSHEGSRLHENAIHRPKTLEEVIQHLQVLGLSLEDFALRA